MKPSLGLCLALVIQTSLIAAEPPGSVLDLSRWKVTLPVSNDRPGRADEISPPAIAKFEHPQFFFVADSGTAVVFRAPCGGMTTKGSKYPRCELREMGDPPDTLAAWATADGGTHTMTANLAITATPAVKKHVVCAQIHDRDDDLLMVRLERNRLFVEREGEKDAVLIADYKLGQRFDLKIEAAAGSVKVWCDGEPKLDWKVSRDGCYFKAGCYTQSNVDKGDQPAAYGEVAIYRLNVSHHILAPGQ